MWLISYCSLWLSLLSSWMVIWSVLHFVRAESRGRPRGQGCRASSPGWTPVEPAAHVDQSSWPWSLSSWKLWAKDLTEPTQASRLLVLLLLVVVLGKGRLYLALEQQPWWALLSPQLSTKQIHSENFTHQHSRGSCDHSEEPPGCKSAPDKGMMGGIHSDLMSDLLLKLERRFAILLKILTARTSIVAMKKMVKNTQ